MHKPKENNWIRDNHSKYFLTFIPVLVIIIDEALLTLSASNFKWILPSCDNTPTMNFSSSCCNTLMPANMSLVKRYGWTTLWTEIWFLVQMPGLLAISIPLTQTTQQSISEYNKGKHLQTLLKCVRKLQSSQIKHNPQDSINEFYHSKAEFVGSYRFQIHLCIPACIISNEFTQEAVINFLPAQFSQIWCKCSQSDFIHSKIF